MPELQTPSLQPATVLSPLPPEIVAQLRDVPVLASLTDETLHCLDGALLRHLATDELLAKLGTVTDKFWILLSGSLRMTYLDGAGIEQTAVIFERGSSLGEVSLLAGIPTLVSARATEPCEVLELPEQQFWQMMTSCPTVRKAVLDNMSYRLNKMQSGTFHQEKMAALGTLAAGLMHELNNPGSAARRAAATLRENLLRLHRLTGRFTRTTLNEAQKSCLFELQECALACKPLTLNTIEQTDKEEALAEWMDSAHIDDAWKMAPTFVAVGLDQEELICAQRSFPAEIFSDALSWIEALISSQQLVGVIEESISRVTELVHAVKSYAYEGRGQRQQLDLNRSIIATLVILGHKIREKQITLTKELDANLPPLETECQGINQVWTNLLDNAIDAVPQQGNIAIKTWMENVTSGEPGRELRRRDLCVLISDDGAGIPLDSQPHIFDPFYTTKPVGVGTGMGLGIVHRIIEQCGGAIHFSSTPGHTEFVVRIPAV
jgi:signal transduction histidine kinase